MRVPPIGFDKLGDFGYPLPTMFAVIKTGGKQYLVKQGDLLKVEKLDLEVGKPVQLETLLLSEEDGTSMQVGAPILKSSVSAEIVEHGRADKISVVKYKAKSKYRRRVGHRQHFTKIKINALS